MTHSIISGVVTIIVLFLSENLSPGKHTPETVGSMALKNVGRIQSDQ